ncbi:hypothetical protein BBK14_11270 [Parafrankia soli]|uniref:Uncharacterized protein n=1 Tax=Parafrankia soli TaxID=2599596 RepID=A0A1S1RBP3_9ACTN|nr:P22 phage major capsid protein family protein [Parafrankia soli]OHV42194.1 hypothetical protein BBK14_11270 [Parafrankia soli]
MAVLTAQGISEVALELLTRTLVLPRTVTMIPGAEFAGSNGDTITVRVPQPGTSRTQVTPGATITYDDVNEVPVTVTLNHEYHAKRITDEESSLDLEDFARQITRVQVAAVATGAENWLAIQMNEMDADVADIDADSAASVRSSVLEARKLLGQANCPAGDRYAACDPEFAAAVLSLDEFNRVDASGSDDALREAVIGRWRGFTWIETNALESGTAVLYHRSGFVFANRVPVMPRGATSSGAVTGPSGIGLRQIFQYAPDILSDASVVSTFCGASTIYDDDAGTSHPRSVKLALTTAGS